MAITIGREQVLAANLILMAGSTQTYRLRYVTLVDGVKTPIDLTGWKAYSQLKANGKTVFDLTPYISVDDQGVILINVSDEASYGLKAQSCDWDLLLEDPMGNVTRLVAGKARIRHVITEGASHV